MKSKFERLLLALERKAEDSGHKWKGPLPKGWTDKSREKFWTSLTKGAPKHKVSECIKRMEGKVSNPGAFCASLADRVIPGWREEAAKERRKKAQALRSRVGLRQPLQTRRDYGEPSDNWITAEEMDSLCPPCAERMRKAGFKKVHASVIRRLIVASFGR